MREEARTLPASAKHRASVGRGVVGALGLTLLLGFALAGLPFPASGSLSTTSRYSALLGVAGLVAVAVSLPRRIWSASFLYAAALAVFNLGLALPLALDLPVRYGSSFERRWLGGSAAPPAMVAATVGVLALCLGTLVATVLSSVGSRKPEQADGPERFQHVGVDRRLSLVGASLIGASFLSWLYVTVVSGGPALLIGSYAEYRLATSGAPLPWVYLGLGLGLVFLSAGASSFARRMGAVAFAAFAVIALPLGLRGEVMFPLLASAAVLARRRPMIRGRYVVLAAVVTLSFISVLRDVRQEGLRVLSTVQADVSPLSGLAELGFSLRPTVEVIRWQQRGERPLRGTSYVAPFERLLARVVPGVEVPPASQDDRLLNTVIRRRVGAVGFSPIAEGFHNWGLAGIVATMFLVGLVLGWIDSWDTSPTRLAMTGVLLVPLLIQVRNDFTPVPFQLLVGAGLVVLLRLPTRPLRTMMAPPLPTVGHRRRSGSEPAAPLAWRAS